MLQLFSHAQASMKAKSDDESLIKFINDMDQDTEWWNSTPMPGKETASDDFEHVFPLLGNVIGACKDAMSMRQFELGCFKRHGKEKTRTVMKGFDRIKDALMDCPSFEVSEVSSTVVMTSTLTKLGKIVDIPKNAWQNA